MKEMNLSITDLAKQTNIGKSSFTGWFNKEYSPSIKAVEKIALALNVSIDYLLGDEPKINPHITVLARASQKMTEEQIIQLCKMAEVLFPDSFK